MNPSEIQRRAPLTPLPMKGTNTIMSNTSEAMNSHGAIFSQTATGTWKASTATTTATTSDNICRNRKWVWA